MATDTTLQPLDEHSFPTLLTFIQPREAETRWRDIPWQTDLRDACRIAAETGKPVFLWAMNGNPLGCT